MPEGKNVATALGIGVFGYLVAATFLHDGYARYFYLIIGMSLALPYIAEHERATATAESIPQNRGCSYYTGTLFRARILIA